MHVRRRRTLQAVVTVVWLAWVGRRRLLPVVVEGTSMLPTLRAGDALLVRRGAAARPGDVVVARFPARPDLLVVKRAVRPQSDGWWVESDNPAATDDSRRYGEAHVLGRVVLRYWPPAQRRLLPPDPSGTRAKAPAG